MPPEIAPQQLCVWLWRGPATACAACCPQGAGHACAPLVGCSGSGVHVWRTQVHTAAQGAIDESMKGSIITASELISLTASATIALSFFGVNLGLLLQPAAFALAFAAKDLSHNFLAGAALHAGHPAHPAPCAEPVSSQHAAACKPVPVCPWSPQGLHSGALVCT